MPGLSSGIHIALQAVLAHAQTIEVIEHNVANANTPGYRRQSALLETTMPSPILAAHNGMGAGMRGGGVKVAQIQRFNLEFFDGRYRSVAAGANYWEAQRDILLQVEATLAETSQAGLLNKLDQFWNGWQNLASDPANLSLRMSLLDDTRALAESFNRRWNQLQHIRSDQNQAVISQVEQINSYADEVARLNREIMRVLSVGEQPNDLLDRRDVLLDRLAEMSGAVSHAGKNGEALVSIGGQVLVVGVQALHLTTRPKSGDTPMVEVVWKDGNPPQSVNLPNGSLKGILEVRDSIIPAQINGLNQLAGELISQVNTLHGGGYGLNNAHALPLFLGADASSMRLNSSVDAASLAAADAPSQAGNNALASAIASLRHLKLAGIGNNTLNDFYNGQVTAFGVMTQNASRNSQTHGLVANALNDQRESVGGVSLDEEAANLAKAQRAYQAAARVLTAYDEMLDRVINGMGLVGR
ncbi:MAG: flagellar hook-associated protein FlgK [Bellilinea sp.]|jgi:flagellar hook-associated protein 1 FlgK